MVIQLCLIFSRGLTHLSGEETRGGNLIIDDYCEEMLQLCESVSARSLIDARDHPRAKTLVPQAEALLEAGAKEVWLVQCENGESFVIELPEDLDRENCVLQVYRDISAWYGIERPERYVGEIYAELAIL